MFYLRQKGCVESGTPLVNILLAVERVPFDNGEDYPNHGKCDDHDGDDTDRRACDRQALTVLLDGFLAIHGLIAVIVLTVAGRLIPGGSVHVVLAVGRSACIIV